MTHHKTDYAIIHAEILAGSQPHTIHEGGIRVAQGKIQEIFPDSQQAAAKARQQGTVCFLLSQGMDMLIWRMLRQRRP